MKLPTSRKFWLAALSLVFAAITEVFDWHVSAETFSFISTIVLGYLGVEGAGDLVSRWKAEAKP